jgi:hypothetical protein
MSAQLMARVYAYRLTHGEQSVLLAMADHADDEGRHVFPSIALLAWKTDYSARQIQRLMRGLVVRQALVVVAPARQHRPAEYRICLDRIPLKEPFRDDTMSPLNVTRDDTMSPLTSPGVTSATSGVTSATSRGDIAMSPEPSVLTISNEPSGELTRSLARERARRNDAVAFPEIFNVTKGMWTWTENEAMPEEFVKQETKIWVAHWRSTSESEQLAQGRSGGGWVFAWQGHLLKHWKAEQRSQSRSRSR